MSPEGVEITSCSVMAGGVGRDRRWGKKLGCAGWAISVVRSSDGNFHACLVWPLGSIMTGEDAWELGIESLGRLIDS